MDNESKRVQSIWDFQGEIGFSDEQGTQIRTSVSALQDKLNAWRLYLQGLQKELNALMEREAPLEEIRTKLNEMAAVQVNMKITDIATARSINQVLTADQLTRWRDIQKRVRDTSAATT